MYYAISYLISFDRRKVPSSCNKYMASTILHVVSGTGENSTQFHPLSDDTRFVRPPSSAPDYMCSTTLKKWDPWRRRLCFTSLCFWILVAGPRGPLVWPNTALLMFLGIIDAGAGGILHYNFLKCIESYLKDSCHTICSISASCPLSMMTTIWLSEKISVLRCVSSSVA